MCTRCARGSPGHDDRTGTGGLDGLGESPGNNGLNEEDSHNWQALAKQGFNFGSVVFRSVPTTPWSPGIQQLIENPHSARLQEGL